MRFFPFFAALAGLAIPLARAADSKPADDQEPAPVVTEHHHSSTLNGQVIKCRAVAGFYSQDRFKPDFEAFLSSAVASPDAVIPSAAP